MAETTPAVGVCTLCGCAGDSFRRARKTRLPQQGWSVHALSYARTEPHRVTAQVEDPKGLLKREWQTIRKRIGIHGYRSTYSILYPVKCSGLRRVASGIQQCSPSICFNRAAPVDSDKPSFFGAKVAKGVYG